MAGEVIQFPGTSVAPALPARLTHHAKSEIADAWLHACANLPFPLSAEQTRNALLLIGSIVSGNIPRGYLSLAGPAGSGKTTVLRAIIDALEHLGYTPALVAPTGKAAARLREVVGRETSTIHGLLYGQPREQAQCPKCELWSRPLAVAWSEGPACPKCKWIPSREEYTNLSIRLQFETRESEGATDTLVAIVDEASMVAAQQHADLLRFPKLALLYHGDPYQLPPVEEAEDAAKPHPDLRNPDAMLARIHRQAHGSAILDAAEVARAGNGRALLKWSSRPGFDVYRRSLDFVAQELAQAILTPDGQSRIVLTGSNRTREDINIRVRANLLAERELIPSTPFMVGDRLQCTSNNRTVGLMNGEIVEIQGAAQTREHNAYYIDVGRRLPLIVYGDLIGGDYRDFRWRVGQQARAVERAYMEWNQGGNRVYPKIDDFMESRGLIDVTRAVHVQWGFAITTHKSQGSQWDNVVYVWDGAVWGMSYRNPTDFNAHLYTGITRAVRHCTIIIPPKE